ncbi:MAG: hypothetical protein QW475_04545 [Candidatus Nitrosocaldus sp.]
MGEYTTTYGTVHRIYSTFLNKEWDPSKVANRTQAIEIAIDKYAGFASDLVFDITPAQSASDYALILGAAVSAGTTLLRINIGYLEGGQRTTVTVNITPLVSGSLLSFYQFFLAYNIRSQTWSSLISGDVSTINIALQADAPEGSVTIFNGRIAITKVKNLDTGAEYVPSDVASSTSSQSSPQQQRVEYYGVVDRSGIRVSSNAIEITYNSTVSGSLRIYHMVNNGSSIYKEEWVSISKGNNNKLVIKPAVSSAGASYVTDTLNFNWFNVSGTTVYLYLNLYLSYKGDRSAVRTASVSTDKPAYSYGEVISLAVSIKDHNGQGVPNLPIYVRILQGIGTNTTVIKDLGNVARTDANGISTFTIAVNAENFPSEGQYTIDVADNSDSNNNNNNNVTARATTTITILAVGNGSSGNGSGGEGSGGGGGSGGDQGTQDIYAMLVALLGIVGPVIVPTMYSIISSLLLLPKEEIIRRSKRGRRRG